ncbi:anti-sigma regulatory factor (Ser/Thr protein kinase) [Asanoa ferruginea]|uniref:Anti-sigma regulatory factor (Ser/Thr protein kinase) n=1 Tax=Asanoa ferruginea TaxID=53367 RepID=A0A3D9ZFQ7_9ACTN|nr:ATP-binding protein [Asanoa ferruginea]REF96258.1 anti-sigma regulatory factor (Ser/Thr protein kinase) [Asanoa ferruginea]
MTTAVAERSWHVVVPHHARGARAARHQLTTELAGTVPSALLDDVVAVTGELVGNAVRHARPLPGGVIRVAWSLTPGGVVEVRVTDGGGTGHVRPRSRPAGPEALNGRGLHIVGTLADRWGVEHDGQGQIVWAELGEHSHSLA